jgi:hypothetical protein
MRLGHPQITDLELQHTGHHVPLGQCLAVLQQIVVGSGLLPVSLQLGRLQHRKPLLVAFRLLALAQPRTGNRQGMVRTRVVGIDPNGLFVVTAGLGVVLQLQESLPDPEMVFGVRGKQSDTFLGDR